MRVIVIFLLIALTFSGAASGQKNNNMSALNQEHYKENPINLFFESYILDVLGELPLEKSESIQEMNLQKVFNTEASDWKDVIKETLHLSNTIDIAIKDLWYKNRDHFKDDNGNDDFVWFSQIFTDKYMEHDSKVDVWGEGALEAAKERIRTAESKKPAEQAVPPKSDRAGG